MHFKYQLFNQILIWLCTVDISWKLIQFSQRQEKDRLARKSALCLILFVVQLSAVYSWYWKQSGSPPIASSMWAALNPVRLRASVRMATDSALISRVFDTGFSLVMRWRQVQRYITWSPAFFVTLAILLTRGRTTPWPLLVFFIWSKTHKDGNYTDAKSVCQEPNFVLKLQRGLVNCHPHRMSTTLSMKRRGLEGTYLSCQIWFQTVTFFVCCDIHSWNL